MAHDLTVDARDPDWRVEPLPVEGVVYIATGLRFAEEAAQAAAQLRKTNPKLPVCLITDQPDFGPKFWDHRILLSSARRGFRDKVLMGLCPYERFLFLDTDTFVVDDLSEAFELLRRFDLIGHQLFEGHDCPVPGIPDAFPEFNTGVLGFRRSPAIEKFFSRWLETYDQFNALNRDGNYHYSNESDQKSFRTAAYGSVLSIGIVGPEYNFVPHHLNFACAKVRIVHSRGIENIRHLEGRLNANLGNRVYVPRLDAVISNDSPNDELRNLWSMVTLQVIRRIGVRLTPVALRNWLRRSPLVRKLFLRNRFAEQGVARDPKWRQPPAS